jgi:hypothetical protein
MNHCIGYILPSPRRTVRYIRHKRIAILPLTAAVVIVITVLIIVVAASVEVIKVVVLVVQ